jgi:hypothetical protein
MELTRMVVTASSFFDVGEERVFKRTTSNGGTIMTWSHETVILRRTEAGAKIVGVWDSGEKRYLESLSSDFDARLVKYEVDGECIILSNSDLMNHDEDEFKSKLIIYWFLVCEDSRRRVKEVKVRWGGKVYTIWGSWSISSRPESDSDKWMKEGIGYPTLKASDEIEKMRQWGYDV